MSARDILNPPQTIKTRVRFFLGGRGVDSGAAVEDGVGGEERNNSWNNQGKYSGVSVIDAASSMSSLCSSV